MKRKAILIVLFGLSLVGGKSASSFEAPAPAIPCVPAASATTPEKKAASCLNALLHTREGRDDLWPFAKNKEHLGDMGKCANTTHARTESYFPEQKIPFDNDIGKLKVTSTDCSPQGSNYVICIVKSSDPDVKFCRVNPQGKGSLTSTVRFVVNWKTKKLISFYPIKD